MPKGYKAFTLIEVVIVVVLVGTLATIGSWKLLNLRTATLSVKAQDALATVQRMQQLADMEPNFPALTRTETGNRIAELRNNLSAIGHVYYQFDPIELAKWVEWDTTTSQWIPRAHE
jgi:prepilin-type N-terminal cleavage/methylation domain-containing protein